MTTNLKLTQTQELYQRDYYQWLNTTAQLLRDRQYNDVDFDNLIEEIEDMGGSQRREVQSRLIILLMHLLKHQYQPLRRSSSWRNTIFEQRLQIALLIKNSPSLKNYYLEIFPECYSDAINEASAETKLPLSAFPIESPFFPLDVINLDFISALINDSED